MCRCGENIPFGLENDDEENCANCSVVKMPEKEISWYLQRTKPGFQNSCTYSFHCLNSIVNDLVMFVTWCLQTGV